MTITVTMQDYDSVHAISITKLALTAGFFYSKTMETPGMPKQELLPGFENIYDVLADECRMWPGDELRIALGTLREISVKEYSDHPIYKAVKTMAPIIGEYLAPSEDPRATDIALAFHEGALVGMHCARHVLDSNGWGRLINVPWARFHNQNRTFTGKLVHQAGQVPAPRFAVAFNDALYELSGKERDVLNQASSYIFEPDQALEERAFMWGFACIDLQTREIRGKTRA